MKKYFFLVLFLVAVFSFGAPDSVSAATETGTWNSPVCEKHGHNARNDCGSTEITLPAGRNYYRITTDFKVYGHRHGGSEILAYVCMVGQGETPDSGNRTQCGRWWCEGSGTNGREHCGPEYGSQHPFDLKYTGNLDRYNLFSPRLFYARSVKDAEVKITGTWTAYYCDPGSTWNGTLCAPNTFTVTATAGPGGTISPATRTVNANSTTTFTVTPNAGYKATVTGCAGALAGNTYTTGPITSNCAVSATFSLNSCQNGATNPPVCSCSPGSVEIAGKCTPVTVFVTATTPHNVAPGTNLPFTYSPTTNSGTTECRLLNYQRVPLTGFQDNGPITYKVPSAIGQYDYYVQCRNKVVVSATDDSDAVRVNTICPPGQVWNGSSACVPAAYTVLGQVSGGNGTISPASRSVNSGGTTTFTVTPNAGYVASVSGTASTGCSSGALSGTTYTTGPINSNCTVTASFTPAACGLTITGLQGYNADKKTFSAEIYANDGNLYKNNFLVIWGNFGATNADAQSLSITLNGKPASSYGLYKSKGQINVFLDTLPAGPVTVVITKNGTCSVTRTVTLVPPPKMTGTLLPQTAACTIPAGQSTCTTTLTWDTKNPVATSAVVSERGTPSPVSGNSGSRAFTAPYVQGGVLFFLYNNGQELARSTVIPACVSNTVWNGTVCAQNGANIRVTYRLDDKDGNGFVREKLGPVSGINYDLVRGSSVFTHNATEVIPALHLGMVPAQNYLIKPNKATYGLPNNNVDYGNVKVEPSSFSLASNETKELTFSFERVKCLPGFVMVNNICTPVSVTVVATTPYSKAPGAPISFLYVPSTTTSANQLIPGADTECLLLDNAKSPLTTYKASSNKVLVNSIDHTVPNVTGSLAYYFLCRNKTFTSVVGESNLINVTAICPLGQVFTGGSCKPTTQPTGVISASNCPKPIPENQSICYSTINWNTQNLIPGKTVQVTKNNPEGTHVSWLASSTGINVAVGHGQTKFFLNHDGKQLAEAVIDTACASGTKWDVIQKKCVKTVAPPGGTPGACATPPNGGTYTTLPSGNLCSPGKPSQVIETATGWNWTCSGVNGGGTVDCSAGKSIASANCPVNSVAEFRDQTGKSTNFTYYPPATGRVVKVYPPAGFTGTGTFDVQNKGVVAIVNGNTVDPRSVGETVISSTGWNYSLGGVTATGCSLNPVNFIVKKNPGVREN